MCLINVPSFTRRWMERDYLHNDMFSILQSGAHEKNKNVKCTILLTFPRDDKIMLAKERIINLNSIVNAITSNRTTIF